LGEILADFFGELWNDHFVLGVLSAVPFIGVEAARRNVQLYEMEGDHYNKILAEIALVASIGITAAATAVLIPTIAVGAKIVAATCITTSLCAGVAVTGFRFGNMISNAIDDVIETGQVSAETWGEIKNSGLEFASYLAGGIVGAGAVDDMVSEITKNINKVKITPLDDYGVVDLSGLKNKTKQKQTGSDTIKFESGKKYHGKGPKSRMEESAKYRSKVNNDPVKSKDWTPAKDDIDAFIDEYFRMEKDGGYTSATNYNQRQSPGKRYWELKMNGKL